MSEVLAVEEVGRQMLQATTGEVHRANALGRDLQGDKNHSSVFIASFTLQLLSTDRNKVTSFGNTDSLCN